MISALMRGDLKTALALLIAVMLSMSIHEMAHGLVSYWFGDPTAKIRGRLSLNPFAHIDWAGLVCLLFFGFGWAKPVPIDPSYYKDQKAGIIWTSFAGPVANFLLSFVCLFIYMLLSVFASSFAQSGFGSLIIEILNDTAVISAGFGIFNLIPIPPLDGAKIFWAFLPDRDYYRMMAGSQWTTLIFIFLIASGVLNQPLGMMRQTLLNWMLQACAAIIGLFV